MPLFKRFVQIGRVCLINYGPDRGKLCVIIDVIDHNRAFIDGPSDLTGVARQPISLKWLSLTDLVIPKLPHSVRLKALRKAFVKADIEKKWNATSWAKKLAARKHRATLTDFDRFKLMLLRKKRSSIVRIEMQKLKKAYNKDMAAKKTPSNVLPRTLNV